MYFNGLAPACFYGPLLVFGLSNFQGVGDQLVLLFMGVTMTAGILCSVFRSSKNVWPASVIPSGMETQPAK